MKLETLVKTSRLVSESPGRLTKIGLLADCITRMDAREVGAGVSFLAGELRQGKIGIGIEMLRSALDDKPAPSPTLTLLELDDAFEQIKQRSGKGSAAERVRLLGILLGRATEEERRFVAGLVTGELRQGALGGVVLEAVARASGISSTAVRRAFMLSADLSKLAPVALTGSEASLTALVITPGKPVLPALAQTAENVTSALNQFGQSALEYKMDGARIQVHKTGSDVVVFTRSLKEVTHAVPEVVEAIARLPVKEIILDGEVLVLGENRMPRSFQTTMRRFGRKLRVADLRRELPLNPYFFDCLYVDGQPLLDTPLTERGAALIEAVPAELLMPRIITDRIDEGETFFDEALSAGHEGIVVKAPHAAYEAGQRGGSWLKVKRSHTLDLVILGAEWGHGRRRGWLSNLHLGARDPASGSFVMLGKTFKGLTDVMLAEQTARLQSIEIARDGNTVFVRPEIVVEIAFSDLQKSPHYPARLALRFARVKRYRPDKRAEQADTIETVRALANQSQS